jgi:hypothetical protein
LHALTTVCKSLQDNRLPPRGLETLPASGNSDNGLRQPPALGAAKSGAFPAETASPALTAEALAAALLALPREDRARLAAMLLGRPAEQGEGEAADGAADALQARQASAEG